RRAGRRVGRGAPVSDGGANVPLAFVVFGATGDLTARKLMPAVAALHAAGELHPSFSVVGVGRDEIDDDDFAERMRAAGDPHDTKGWGDVAAHSRYVGGDYGDPATFERLEQVLAELDEG